jgi:hypothetical protein
VVFAGLAIAGGRPAAAQEQASLDVSGFVAASLFAQDRTFGFGNGQSALFAAAGSGGDSPWTLGGDVRNTRITMSMRGPELGEGLVMGGVLEMDFFGGFNGAGAFSEEQPLPRLRLAYAELRRGRASVIVGQAFTPLFGNVPVSTSHVAFPLGLGSAGLVGWRNAGLFTRVPLTPVGAGLQLTSSMAVFRGSWSQPGAQAHRPQLEARLDAAVAGSVPWSAYVVGHYDRKGTAAADGGDLVGWALAGGARVDVGPWTLHGNAYRGRAIGQQMGQLAQFGDIEGDGAWLQTGLKLGGRWSVWAFHGLDDPDDGDFALEGTAQARLHNTLSAAELRYALREAVVGVELLRARTTWASADERWTRAGWQMAASVVYRFSLSGPLPPPPARAPEDGSAEGEEAR